MKYIIPSFLFITFIACNNNKTPEDKPDAVPADTTQSENSKPDTMSATTVSDADKEFVLKAGMGNTAEIEAGALAATKSADSSIKEFGKMMQHDHGDAQQKLKTLAASLSLYAPDSADKEHAELKKKLMAASGKPFDALYAPAQIKDHEATIALFEKQINTGTNPSLKEFAVSTLPHLKLHLEKAKTLTGKK